MELNKYQYILEVAQKRSITRASESLHISQPYLSKFVSSLEDRLGLKLFDRSSSPIELTYAGDKYVEYIKKILQLEEEMNSEINNIVRFVSESLTIGVPAAIGSGFLPHFLPQFWKTHPNVKVIMDEAGSSVLIDKILNNQVDVGLVVPLNMPPEISYDLLSVKDMLLVVPGGHRLFQPDKLHNVKEPLPLSTGEIKSLHKEEFIVATPYQGVGVLTRRIFDYYRIEPKINIETRTLETAYKLSLGGMGLTVIPSIYCGFFQKQTDRVCYYNIGVPAFQWSLVAAYKNNVELSPVIMDFVRLAKNSIHLYG